MSSGRFRPARPLRWAGAAVLVTAAALLAWQLSNLLLLVFGAVLVALLLTALASALAARTRLGYRPALLITGSAVIAGVAGLVTLFGAQVVADLGDLAERAPDIVARLDRQFDLRISEKWLIDQLGGLIGDGSLLRDVTGISAVVVSASVNFLLLLVGGVYLAYDPATYRAGLMMLVPPAGRKATDEALSEIAHALRLWLAGQLLAMTAVAVCTTAGLIALGVPSAFALGFLAGLLEFVPYVGPVLSAVPAVGVALTEGPSTALWVALLYLVLQQLEAVLITPLVQQRTVHLPPALTIFSILAFGVLFGFWGVIFGMPLTVVCFVLVRRLWVRGAIGEDAGASPAGAGATADAGTS